LIYYFNFRGAHGIFLVYDITDIDSFKDMRLKWSEDAMELARKDAVKVILANKSDYDEKRKITSE